MVAACPSATRHLLSTTSRILTHSVESTLVHESFVSIRERGSVKADARVRRARTHHVNATASAVNRAPRKACRQG